MEQSLFVHTAFETGLHDQKFMFIYGFQMSEKTLQITVFLHVIDYITRLYLLYNKCMLNRHEYREKIVFALYQHLLLHKDLNECFDDNFEDDDNEYLNIIKNDLIEHKVDYIYEISQYLKKWSFERLNLVEQAILLETVSEIKTKVNDSAVAIDEAITLAKQYCDEDSYKFINGVLDNICKNSQ